MLVKVIGGHGGQAPGFRTTSFLVDGKLLIDAGSVAQGIPVDEQVQIDNILISHPHLDHICEMAFMCDNCFGQKGKPFEVYSSQITKDALLNNIMNDVIWPNFSKLPNTTNPTIRFHDMLPYEPLILGDYTIKPVPVNHPCSAFGFIVERKDSAILFTQDTGPTDEIWEIGKSYKNLKAIFTEVSFPNKLLKVAMDSYHHTPATLMEEIKKMPRDIPIFVGHLKPAFIKQLYQEISDLNCDRISILGSDNSVYHF